jgi:8-amino-7-oxononanoate synthase
MSFEWLSEALRDREREGLLRRSRLIASTRPGWCAVEGRELLNLAANDYLGLAGDARLIEAAARAARESGTGARASALVCGRHPWIVRLEERLAAFHAAEAALVFPTGYAANAGTIAALVGAGDSVLCDRLNHASLVDGCRLSGARLRVFPHGDSAAVDQELSKAEAAPRRLVTTDSVFSMDGDAAPLRELVEICERHRAMLLVDEAHATGVNGPTGRGLLEELDLRSECLIKVGTLSKALGSQGGYVVGTRTQIDWLFNTARTQMFSTALAPAACGAAIAALDIVDAEPERRTHLRQLATLLRDRLSQRGVPTLGERECPIVPIVCGTPQRALAIAARLEDAGFLVAAIRPPTVPRNSSRLRISLSAAHQVSDVMALADAVIAALERLGPEAGNPGAESGDQSVKS